MGLSWGPFENLNLKHWPNQRTGSGMGGKYMDSPGQRYKWPRRPVLRCPSLPGLSAPTLILGTLLHAQPSKT